MEKFNPYDDVHRNMLNEQEKESMEFAMEDLRDEMTEKLGRIPELEEILDELFRRNDENAPG